MKLRIKRVATFLFSFLLVVGFSHVLAAPIETNPPINNSNPVEVNPPLNSGESDKSAVTSVRLENPLGEKTLTQFFLDLLQVVLIFAVPIIVFFIIYAGFLYVTARGNQEQVTKATRALGYAILGGVIILGAQVILTVIQGTVAAVQGQ